MIGTAPRSPAQPSSVCSRRLNRERNSERYTASGRATSVRNTVTSDGDAEHRQDPAGEHEQAERQEHRDLHEPGQAVVEARQAALVDVGAVAQHDAGDVHGQEPAAAQVRGRPERQQHQGQAEDGVEAVVVEVDAVDDPGHGRARTRSRARPRAPSGGRTSAASSSSEPSPVVISVMRLTVRNTAMGSLLPDSSSSRSRTCRGQPHLPGAQHREDGGGVRGRDDGAEQQRLERRKVGDQHDDAADETGGHQRPDGREDDPAAQDRADARPARVEPAGEQDQRQRDDADRAGQPGVVEVDAAEPLGARRACRCPGRGAARARPSARRPCSRGC